MAVRIDGITLSRSSELKPRRKSFTPLHKNGSPSIPVEMSSIKRPPSQSFVISPPKQNERSNSEIKMISPMLLQRENSFKTKIQRKVFRVALNNLKQEDKTIKEIPVIVHNILLFLYRSLLLNDNYFEDKPINSFKLYFETPKNVLTDVSSLTLNKINELEVNQLIEMGFSINDSYMLKQKAFSEDRIHFFENLNINKGITNEEFVKLYSLISRFDNGVQPNLYKEIDVKMGFLLLKTYLLNLPIPLLENELLVKFDMALAIKTKNNEEKISHLFLEEIKSSLLNDSLDHRVTQFETLKEIVLFIKFVLNQQRLNEKEKESIYLCYFNAMLQNSFFRKEYIEIIDNCFVSENYSKELDTIYQFESEFVIKKYTNVLFAPYIISVDTEFDDQHCIKGNLFVTNQRMIFTPNDPLDSIKQYLINQLGTIHLWNINSIQVNKKETTHYLRIICNDLKVLSFRLSGEIDNFEVLLNDIKSSYQMVNETDYIPINLQIIRQTNRIILNDCQRLEINENVEVETNYIPKFPMINCGLKLTNGLKPIVVYKSKNGSKIIRFPIKSDETDETTSSTIISSFEKGFSILPIKCELKNKYVIEKCFKRIQELIPIINFDLNKYVLNYNDVTGEFSGYIQDILSTVKNTNQEMQNNDTIILLQPSNISEKVVSVYSFLIQIMKDPFYRTIEGFFILFQKELLSFNFFDKFYSDNSIYFILLLSCLIVIIHQNNSSFEFGDKLIQFLFSSYLSYRFSEFNDNVINPCNSLIRYVLYNKEYFTEIQYKGNETELSLIIPESQCCLLIDYWINFNKQTTCLFTSKLMITKNTNMNLVQFPPIPISLKLWSSVSIINLNNNKLKEFPLALCELDHLKEIRLNDNLLYWIPYQISNLTNLTFLSLSNNKLSHLPDLSNIPLRKLDISSNVFHKDCSFEFGKDLEQLKAAELSSYPTILRDLPCLTSLDCSKCQFDVSDIIFKAPINLQELILSGCHLPIIPEEITQLTITKLDVSDNSIRKMNYSFFSMKSLRVLNLNENHNDGSNALFKTMKSLTVLTGTTQIKRIKRSLSNPSVVSTEKELNDKTNQPQLQQLEKIIVTGGDFRKEIFSFLQKKLNKEGIVQMTSDHSFTFELKDQKKKKRKMNPISVIEMSSQEMKEAIWKLHRSIFVICKKEKNGNEIEEVFEILQGLKKPILGHVVFGTEMNAKVLSKYNKEIFSLNIHLFSNEKKITKCPTLTNKIIKQINKLNEVEGVVEEESEKLVKELELLRIPGFCLSISKIKEIMKCLELKEMEKVLEYLIRNGYFITNENIIEIKREELLKDNREVIVDLEFFKLTDKLFKKGISKNGFVTTSVFEIFGIKNENLTFIIDILEMYGIIFGCNKITCENIGIGKEFIDVYNSCVDQTKHISNELINKENSSNGSSFVPFIITELRDIEDLLICPHHEFISDYESSSWPLQHHKNENEIGRSFTITKYNWKIIKTIICTFMIKYEVHCYWKNGTIVVITDPNGSGKGYLMVGVDEIKRSINIRIRYLVSNERIPFYIAKVLKETRMLLENILDCFESEIEKQLIMCSECLFKGEINCLTEREINDSIEKFKFHVKCRICDHTINTVSCSLDMITETLPKKYLNSLTELDFIKEIGIGSNSTISLWKRKCDNELVISKIGNIDLNDGGLYENTTAIEIFSNLIEEYLREIFFITFPKNEFVAKIFGYSIDPLFVTMEYFNGGSLYQIIKEKSILIDEQLTLIIAKQIAKGMQSIHTYKMPLIHRDLKSPNILVRLNGDNSFNSCALSDFGQTVSISDNFNLIVECPYWLAPEVINGEPLTQKSDIFSFAIVLWELKTKQPPYTEFKYFSEIREKVKNGWRLPLNNQCTFLNSLIIQCWDPIPQNRPSFDQIVDILNGIVI